MIEKKGRIKKMSKIIELKEIDYKSRKAYPLLLNLSKVTAVCMEDAECHIYTDDARFHVSKESYEKLRFELKACNDGNIAYKLLELQSDHTWIKQAVGNLVVMLRTGNTDYKPAILIGCSDDRLGAMFENCYDLICKMQKRIKELKEQLRMMKEPKKQLYI